MWKPWQCRQLKTAEHTEQWEAGWGAGEEASLRREEEGSDHGNMMKTCLGGMLLGTQRTENCVSEDFSGNGAEKNQRFQGREGS